MPTKARIRVGARLKAVRGFQKITIGWIFFCCKDSFSYWWSFYFLMYIRIICVTEINDKGLACWVLQCQDSLVYFLPVNEQDDWNNNNEILLLFKDLAVQKFFWKKKFVDITQQCFALIPQVNFPANNLNFHWIKGDVIEYKLYY